MKPREEILAELAYVDGLKAERDEVKRELAEQSERLRRCSEAWSEMLRHDFLGPCVHGRDPYERCDEDDSPNPCGDLASWQVAVRVEREACAQLALAQPFYPDTHTGMRQQWVKEQIAAAIRARGTT